MADYKDVHSQRGGHLCGLQERQPFILWVQVIRCIIAQQENGAHPGQLSLYELPEARTFHKALPFVPEMEEVLGITPFLAPQGLGKGTLKVWAIIAVFTDSKRS